MPPLVVVRPASVKDINEVLSVYTASFVPMLLNYHPSVDPSAFEELRLREMWQQLLSVEDCDVFLASFGDSVAEAAVAVMALHATPGSDSIELAKLFVVPEHQSAGIGREMTNVAIEHARSSGFSRVHLWTWEISHQSRRLYESLGFVLTEEIGVSGYPGIPLEADVTLRYEQEVN